MQKTVFNIQEEYRARCASGDFVPSGNHHVTLRFLGKSDALADIARAMREAVRDAKPFTLKLAGHDSFPKGQSQTAYLSLNGHLRELDRLHATLETALWEAGFVRGGRFHPHITLGRRVVPAGPAPDVPPAAFRVSSIVLFESRRASGQMVYTPVHTETF